MDGESTNAQDARIEQLFRALDVENKGHLDLENLRAGLKWIDHPLKNATSLVQNILQKIDTDHDDRISFEEFKTFVKHTELELRFMFEAIDTNHDGSLDRSEMQRAFRKAGLTVSNAKLEQFFSTIDTNHDGMVSFDEWRDFLLFLPDAQNLEAVLSYYNSTTVSISPEGDVHVSSGASTGLGTFFMFLKPHFASVILVAHTPPYSSTLKFSPSRLPFVPLSSSSEAGDDESLAFSRYAETMSRIPRISVGPKPTAAEIPVLPATEWSKWENLKPVLIACVPSTGYFAAGALAGIASRTATAPIDRLKVYLIAQTKKPDISFQAIKSGSLFNVFGAAFRTTSYAFKDLWAAGGLRSLYAGNGINVVKVMPESAIKFGSFEAMKRVCARAEGHNNPMKITVISKVISGGMAGVVSQFVVYPLDTLKFRMQCETVAGGLHGNRLIIATAHKMWTTGGIRCFYKGIGPGLIGMAPYAAIDLGTFEYLKNYVIERNVKLYGLHEDDARPSSPLTAVMGAFTGALGATIVYPVNLLRTRLQSQGTILHPRTYNGFWDAARITMEGEGFRGLYKGLVPNLVKVVPAVSITYVVYEKCKKRWELR